MRRNWLFKALLISTINVCFANIALAVPAGAWRTRKTGLSNREECLQRAFDALENVGLYNIDISGKDRMAVYGETEQTISFVVCQNGGSLAAVFCSSYNRQESIDTCDFIAAYMYEFGEQL